MNRKPKEFTENSVPPKSFLTEGKWSPQTQPTLIYVSKSSVQNTGSELEISNCDLRYRNQVEIQGLPPLGTRNIPSFPLRLFAHVPLKNVPLGSFRTHPGQ